MKKEDINKFEKELEEEAGLISEAVHDIITIARKIAETITNEEILTMFNLAKVKIKDWTKVSSVNKGMTKGAAWNILAKDFDVNHNYHILAKTNMVREFGEFLPDAIKPAKKEKLSITPIHQTPIF